MRSWRVIFYDQCLRVIVVRCEFEMLSHRLNEISVWGWQIISVEQAPEVKP